MLVLSRKQEQQIQIGEHVTITILQVKGRSVRIGINAPQEMHIMRSELSSNVADQAVPVADQAVPVADMPTPQSLSPEGPASQPGPLAKRRRDRVREARRSPAFGRRRLIGTAGDGPLRRFVDERGRGEQQSAFLPTRHRDNQQWPRPVCREPSCESSSDHAQIDRPQIDLYLDPYQQGAALPHGRATRFDSAARFDDVDESPIVRALRWRA